MTTANGFLAIWSDISAADETDYLHWLTREHTTERTSLPGFLGVRVFRSLDQSVRRYFILYALADEQALASPEYLARLNAPTPWSSRIMPKLGNFRRGGGRVVHRRGVGKGAVVSVASLTGEQLAATSERLRAASLPDRMVAARLLEVDGARTGIPTAEKSLRSGDTAFAGLAIHEALDEAALAGTAGLAAGDAERFRQIFAL